MIRFLAIGIVGLIALASPAYADGPFNGGYEPVPIFRWTGFYFGANAGYGWAANPGDITYESTLGPDRSRGPNAGGEFGGGQIGYNWQGVFGSSFVAGVEADIQGSNIDDTIEGTTASGLTGSVRQDLQWFGTVRGRLGWAFDRTLVYGTGGFAYGRVTDVASANDGMGNSITLRGDPDRTGYVVGGGVEHAVSPTVSFKVEYQYINFGEQSLSGVFTSGDVARSSPVDDTFHTVRFGVNIKLY
jgi:outer membrane immunogenic protein